MHSFYIGLFFCYSSFGQSIHLHAQLLEREIDGGDDSFLFFEAGYLFHGVPHLCVLLIAVSHSGLDGHLQSSGRYVQLAQHLSA